MSSFSLTESQGVFAATVAIIAIALSVLNPSWKIINDILHTLPADKRKLKIKLNDIDDPREKDKYALLRMLFFGVSSFVAAIALSLLSMLGTVSEMLNYELFAFQQGNYEFGKGCLFISVFFFIVGFVFIGYIYFIKLLALVRGIPDATITEITQTKSPKPDDIIKERMVEKRGFVLIIIIFIAELFLVASGHFNSWENILISVAITISGYFLINWIANWIVKLKARIKDKKTKQQNHKPNDN